MKKDNHANKNVQIVWGAALILVGVAVFFRVPQVVPQLVEMGQSVTTISIIRISFYILAIILVGGGINKIVKNVRSEDSEAKGRPADDGDNGSDR